MRRADRLLQIVQILRREDKPVSAQAIAAELEVAQRTIYRDMLAMESINVPVRGEAGVGYVLEDGYDLPPLIFNTAELEALMLGARFVETHGDPDQAKAAKNMVAKVGAVLPENLRQEFFNTFLYAPPLTKRPTPSKIDSAELRRVLRAGKIVDISYGDENGNLSSRTIWPIALGYFETKRFLAAWCELREDFRTFRTDRILSMHVTERVLPRSQAALMKQWLAADKARGRDY